jgi:methionine sulfoxide reductase heme-binding subunit
VTVGVLLWDVARVAGLSAFVALSMAVLSGVALRSAVLGWLGTNRAVRSMHGFVTVLWLPLGVVHLAALLLDQTAGVGPIDVLVPFRASYGTLAIGLGTCSVWVLGLAVLVAWRRRRLPAALWVWLHRLGYVGFALVFLHALVGGSDFAAPLVSALTWGVAAALLVLAAARVLWGRLPG